MSTPLDEQFRREAINCAFLHMAMTQLDMGADEAQTLRAVAIALSRSLRESQSLLLACIERRGPYVQTKPVA